MHNTWFVIFSIGLAQGLFLIFAFLSLKGRRPVSVYLIASIVLCFTSLILTEWLKTFMDIREIPHLYRIGETIPLLMGPLFLIYVMSVVLPDFRFSRKLWMHFVPFVFFFLLFLPFYLKSGDFKATYIASLDQKPLPTELALFSAFKGLHTLLYFAWSLVFLKEKASQKDKAEPPWLKLGLFKRLIWLQIWAVVLIYVMVGLEYFFPEAGIEPDRVSSVILTLAFFALAFTTILYPTFLIPAKNRSKYFSSGLRSEVKQRILKELLQLLDSRKPYLNAELNLSALAEMLSVNANQLSQVINEKLGMNFQQLMNQYRVEEVKKNIHDPSRTLLGIALESGFNSKSTFNRIFKESTGLTPSRYKKSYK